MSTQPPKSLGEAIEEFTEDDVPTPVTDEETNTDVDEGEAEGAEEESEESPASDDEDEETDEETSEEDEGEDDEDTDFPSEQPGGEEEEATGDVDIVDALTPEDLKILKENPQLTKVRKLLLKGYNDKMRGRDQDLRLVDLYKSDPIGLLSSMATAHGLQLVQPTTPKQQEAQEDKVAEAKAEFEKLWGDKAGPEVRQAFEKLYDALSSTTVAPMQQALQRVMEDNERARMQSEEDAWLRRHKDVLTKEIYDQVVALGNSGRYMPGKDATPSDFLDDLLDVVLSKRAKKMSKEERATATKKLARRIEKNRADREPSGVSSKASVKKVNRLEKEPESFRNIGEALEYADGLLGEEA